MTSKQEESETPPPSHVLPLDDLEDVSSIGCLRDSARLSTGGDNEVSALVPAVSSSSTTSVRTKDNREFYVYKESVDSKDLPPKDIYAADNNEAKDAVTYQLKDTLQKEAPASVYDCEEDSDDFTEDSNVSNTDFDEIQAEDVFSDVTNPSTDGIQPANVIIKPLEDGAKSPHSSGVNTSECIRPYAVAYRPDGRGTTERRDQTNLTDDHLQPYAVVYEEQDDRNADQTSRRRRSVSNAPGASAHATLSNTSSEADGDRKDGLRPNPVYVPNVPQPMVPGGRIYYLSGAQLACIVTVSVIVGALVLSAVVFPAIFRTANQQQDSDMETTLPSPVTDEATVEWKGSQPVEYMSSSSSTVAGIGDKESEPMKLEFGGEGSKPGNFCGATGVVVSPSNEIFVTDKYNRRVQVFSMKGAYLRHFSTVVSENEIDTMKPDSIAIDADCHLWVVGNNGSSGYVVQYTKTGHRLKTLHPSFPNNTLNGVAVNAPRNHVIVAENWRDYTEVKVLLFDGTVVRKFGKLQTRWSKPTRVATNADGNILVSDWRHGGVHVYNETGQYMFSFGEDGVSFAFRFSEVYVSGVCVVGSGEVLLSYGDWNVPDVVLYTDRGQYVRSIVTNLTSADGLAVGPDGQLVVTSQSDDIVLVLPQY